MAVNEASSSLAPGTNNEGSTTSNQISKALAKALSGLAVKASRTEQLDDNTKDERGCDTHHRYK